MFMTLTTAHCGFAGAAGCSSSGGRRDHGGRGGAARSVAWNPPRRRPSTRYSRSDTLFPLTISCYAGNESSFIDAATSYWKLLKQNLKYAFILISGDTSLVPLYVDEEYAPSVCSCSCNCFGPNKWVIQTFHWINACKLCATEPCYRVYCNKYPAEFIMNYYNV